MVLVGVKLYYGRGRIPHPKRFTHNRRLPPRNRVIPKREDRCFFIFQAHNLLGG